MDRHQAPCVLRIGVQVGDALKRLTQGWQLLRVKDVSLMEQVERARADMRQALWTTFGPKGMDSIFSAIQSRRNAG